MGKGKGARNALADRLTMLPHAVCVRGSGMRRPHARTEHHRAYARRGTTPLCARACLRPPFLALAIAGQSASQFELASALTKKESRVIRKAEYMIPYHMARCPNYGWKESAEYACAELLKEKIAGIGARARPSCPTRTSLAHGLFPSIRSQSCPPGPNSPDEPVLTTWRLVGTRVRESRSQGEETLGGEFRMSRP